MKHKARPQKVGNKWRVAVDFKPNRTDFIGRGTDGFVFNSIEYETEQEAFDHIENDDRLILRELTLPEKIKELQARMGLTNEQMAEELEVSKSTYKNWKMARFTPYPHSMEMLEGLFVEWGVR